MPTTAERKALIRYRYVILIAPHWVFLPPLALQFQADGRGTVSAGSGVPACSSSGNSARHGECMRADLRVPHSGSGWSRRSLATTFFFGRHWCSHLCPVGADCRSWAAGSFLDSSSNYPGSRRPFPVRLPHVYLLAPRSGSARWPVTTAISPQCHG